MEKQRFVPGTDSSIHKPACLTIAAFQREVLGSLGHLGQVD